MAARAERHRSTRLVFPHAEHRLCSFDASSPLTRSAAAGQSLNQCPVPPHPLHTSDALGSVRDSRRGAFAFFGRSQSLAQCRLAAVAQYPRGRFAIVVTDSLRRRHRAQAHVRGDHDEPRVWGAQTGEERPRPARQRLFLVVVPVLAAAESRKRRGPGAKELDKDGILLRSAAGGPSV